MYIITCNTSPIHTAGFITELLISSLVLTASLRVDLSYVECLSLGRIPGVNHVNVGVLWESNEHPAMALCWRKMMSSVE